MVAGRRRRPPRPASAGSAARARRGARSRAAWSETASVNCGPSAVSRRIPGTTPRGRDRDVARPEAEPRPVVQRRDGLEDAVEVEQRLAHAHEHDVRQPLVRRQASRRAALRTWSRISAVSRSRSKPELAGRAERAADGAAGLARDAQRVPLALAAAAPGSASAPTRRARRPTAGAAPSRSARRRPGGSPCRRRCRTGTQRPARRGAAAGSVRASAADVALPPQIASATWRAR